MKWTLLTSVTPTNQQELIDVLLANRGIKNQEVFLDPIDPLKLSLQDVGLNPEQMSLAIERLNIAKEKQEKIVIFGDYDCDGVCATTVLWETLHELGCQVFPFIPDRAIHGYGLSIKAIEELVVGEKPSIIISVDNGIVAHAAWKRLREEGIFTILTDHHQPDAITPEVDVMLHTLDLCGTTVAWMLARELNPNKACELLDLCALATIADQVPLTGANRSFAKFGLRQLNQTSRLGLKLLIEASGLEMGQISTRGVSFGIVPRINAMGRLSSALDALRALCTKNEARAKNLVLALQATNVDRQDMTGSAIEIARLQASGWEKKHIIVVASTQFHEGVIGLIASKLTEEFHKPSVVISIGAVTSKGSARSIPGVNITDLLRQATTSLMELGGHPMAAGLRLESTQISDFQSLIEDLAAQQIPIAGLVPSLTIDCRLPLSLLTMDTVENISRLEPFGALNREPIFQISNLKVIDSRTIGKEGKHLKLGLQFRENDTEARVEAIGFGLGKIEIEPQASIECVGMLQVNEWRGKRNLQLVIKDLSLVH